MKIFRMKLSEQIALQEEKLIELCDEKRKKDIAKYKFEKDRYRSIMAGLLLRYAYHDWEYTNNKQHIGQFEIVLDSFGKPSIKGEERFQYSLSHSDEYAVIAVDEYDVGIDIEEIGKCRDYRKVARRFFHDIDIARLEMANEPENTFAEIWTQKESYIKYLGRGLSYGMNDFFVEDGKVIDLKEGNNLPIYIKEYNDLEKYRISVCSALADFPNRICDIFPEEVK